MASSIGKILMIIVSLTVYLLCLKAIPGNINSQSETFRPPFSGDIPAYELSHERSSYATLVSLDERRKFDLTVELADVSAPDAGYIHGKYFSYFPPGLAITSLPIYIVGKQFNLSLAAAYFMVSIFAAAGLWVLYRICEEIFGFQRWLSLFVVFSTGLASTYLNFSITFYQHVPSAFLLMLGFYSAWRYGRYQNWAWAALSWSCYGVASFFDYPNLIMFLPVLFYLIYQGVKVTTDRSVTRFKVNNSLIFSAVFLLILGASHMYYNQVNFGDWWKFSNTLPNYNPRREGSTLEDLKKLNIEEVSAAKSKVNFALGENNFINGLHVLLFDIDKSLLLHMPIFLFAILGLIRMRNRITPELLTIILIIAANLVLYASFHDPWGGWGFGPRYLVTSMPFFNIIVGFWLQKDNILKRLAVLPFTAYGAFAAILGAVTKNLLVPKVEILELDLPHKVWSELKYLKLNENGTFIYNEYISGKYSLTEYYVAICGFVAFILLIIVFVLPYTKYGNKNQQQLA